MKKKALYKDIKREILNSKGRFLSIVIMILVGVMVFIGLKVTGPAMQENGNKYFKDRNYQDAYVKSTYGLNDRDIELLQNIPDIKYMETGYELDLVETNKDNVIRLLSNSENINNVEVIEGRNIENSNEIFLDKDLKSEYKLGDIIKFKKEKNSEDSDEDKLDRYEYKIVGFGTHPEFIIADVKGTSSVGSGQVAGFGIISKDDFNLKEYSKIRFLFNDLENLMANSEEYKILAKNHEEDIEKALKNRSDERYLEVQGEINENIEDGRLKIKEAKDKLNEAEDKLIKGEEAIEEGYIEYNDGENKLNKAIEEGKTELEKNRLLLVESKSKLAQALEEYNFQKNKYEDGLNQYNQGVEEYEKNKNFIENSEKEVIKAKDELENGKESISLAEKEILQGEEELKNNKEKLEKAEIEINKSKELLKNGKKELDENKEKLDNAKKELDENREKLDSSILELKNKKAKLIKDISNINEVINNLNIKLKEIEELENGKLDLLKNQLSIKEKELNEKNNLLIQTEKNISLLEQELKDINAKIENETNPENLEKLKLELKEKTENYNKLKLNYKDIKNDIELRNQEINNLKNNINLAENLISQKENLIQKLDESDNIYKNLNVALNEIRKAEVVLEQKDQELNKAELEYDKNYSSYINALKNYENSEKIIKEKEEEVQNGKKLLEENEIKLQKSKEIISEKKKEIASGEEKLAISIEKINFGKQELENGKNKLDSTKKVLDAGKFKLDSGKIELDKNTLKLEEAEKQLKQGEETLKIEEKNGRLKLSEALTKLKDAEIELDKNKIKFLEEKSKALEEIKDAEEKLQNSDEILSSIKKPIYSVVTSNKENTYYDYMDMASRLDIISNIFPVFFFFVAMLVSLTTMTRMVEEQRLQIGTLKALGYFNRDIVKKYFIYGAFSSIIGSILGVIIGHKIIAKMIYDSYATMYVFEDYKIKFNVKYSIIAIIIGFLTTAVIAALVTSKSLKENASTLMRGKPPKSGNRILLEKIKPIWNRLSFLQKVTMRNIFRYKNRMFMTIIGVAGCTGLLFLGFGIKTSIMGVVEKQFSQVTKFDYITIYDKNLDSNAYEKYIDKIKTDRVIDNYKDVFIDNLSKEDKFGIEQKITLIVPKDDKDFDKFVKLENRKTKKKLSLNDDGLIITEKLSKIFDLKNGDNIEFKDSNGHTIKGKIIGITENYAGHYIYMTKEYYEKIFNEDYNLNANLINAKGSISEDEKQKFLEDILENDAVLMTSNLNTSLGETEDLMSSLNIVVFVIIICSSLLAFVVLYNLTNINISERKRELSTIKVLGFYPKEVTEYVYRETMLLTIIGIILGFGIGNWMVYLIRERLIPDMAMLDPQMRLSTYLYSAGITLIFSIIVMFVVHKKLKDINMVEALKSVE